MFKWLTTRIENARIAWVYLGYEQECRKLWIAEAERKFSTAELAREIRVRMDEPQRHVEAAFDDPIQALEAKSKNIADVISEAERKLAILQRDYRSKLDAAYNVLNDARAQLTECRKTLAEAYDDLAEAKQKLDRWYSRAEGKWFGNAGKKLPTRAIFGQDLRDRDRYKSERDSAARAINGYKHERSRLERRLNDARGTVGQIKGARQLMINLKKQGFDKRLVTGTIRTGQAELQAMGVEIADLAQAREAYLRKARTTLGVEKLERRLANLRQKKVERIAAFDDKAEVAARRARHREAWLAERRTGKR